MTSTSSNFTDREAAIIEILTQRFADRSLNASIVDVNKLEGGEEPTLRLTLDDVSSTDFSRRRVADSVESVDALAEEAARELENPGVPIGEDSDSRNRRVAERAYAIYQARGGTDGLDESDWLQAERELDDTNPAPVDAGPNVPLASGGRGERAAEVMPDVNEPGEERKLPPPGPSQ